MFSNGFACQSKMYPSINILDFNFFMQPQIWADNIFSTLSLKVRFGWEIFEEKWPILQCFFKLLPECVVRFSITVSAVIDQKGNHRTWPQSLHTQVELAFMPKVKLCRWTRWRKHNSRYSSTSSQIPQRYSHQNQIPVHLYHGSYTQTSSNVNPISIISGQSFQHMATGRPAPWPITRNPCGISVVVWTLGICCRNSYIFQRAVCTVWCEICFMQPSSSVSSIITFMIERLLLDT
jgi:hypothetical protein